MSLKGDKYETVEEVQARLQGTVVLYDGSPVYINAVNFPEGENEIARVYFYPIPFDNRVGGEGTRKYLSSRKFDLTPFKMGYFNHEGEAIFASRIPVRQYKQGLSQATVGFAKVSGKKHDRMAFNNFLRSPGFIPMFKGEYPSFKDALDMLGDADKVQSVAVSRMFAFHIDHDLEALLLVHKGNKCGITMRGERGIRLPEKFHFLKEQLEECRIPIS